MKMNKIKDERVIQLNNKIHSEAYFVVLFLSAASVFVKSYFMELPFLEYAVEFGLIVLSTIYIAVRGMLIGNEFMNTSKSGKISAVSSIILMSLIISIVNGIRNYFVYGDKYTGVLDGHFIAILVVTFISSVIFTSVIIGLLYWSNGKGQQRIEKKLKDEEDQE